MDKLNILSIHYNIIDNFKKDVKNIEYYKNKLCELNISKKNSKLSDKHKKQLNDNIKNIKKKLDDINNENSINFYLLETTNIIENYKKILHTPIKTSFTGKSKSSNYEKEKIIKKYLEIAQKYVDIDISEYIKNPKIKCNNCKNKKMFNIIDNSIYICLLCGSQQEIILHTSCYNDVDRINISSKYTYDRKVHFRDCINQYQGKQNSTIDDKVYEDLIDQFDKHHLLIGDKNTPKEKRCKKITKQHIYIFLKELNYSKHYENVNLIYYNITGKKPDDISHLEERLLDDFDILTEYYDKKFKNKEGFSRKNFINTQYVLYQFLMRYKHPCNKQDFAILKTVDRKSFHDDITKKCFEDLGWNHTPLF